GYISKNGGLTGYISPGPLNDCRPPSIRQRLPPESRTSPPSRPAIPPRRSLGEGRSFWRRWAVYSFVATGRIQSKLVQKLSPERGRTGDQPQHAFPERGLCRRPAAAAYPKSGAAPNLAKRM